VDAVILCPRGLALWMSVALPEHFDQTLLRLAHSAS